jgi:DNA-binding MurR/RpiR family transcriptional regulator
MALVSTTSRGKDLRGCLVAIRATRASLRTAEQRVADYVLEHSGEVVHSSVSEVAQASGTSEATVVRLCRALGYRGFPEMKLVLARDLARQEEPGEEGGAVLTAADGVDVVARRVFEAGMQALIDTMELQQASHLEHAVALLAAARRIVFCGVGDSGLVVQAAAHSFQLIGLEAQAQSDPQLQRIAVCHLGPGDAVVGIAYLGTAPEVVAALRIAAAAGAATIGLTSQAGSPLGRTASVTLLVAGPEIRVVDQPIAPHGATLALIDALFAAVALRRQEDTTRALARVAQARQDF